jgi:low temperature requirement protein LtrA
MVAGIVFLAVGLKKVIEYVADTEHHDLTDPLTGIPLFGLYGGVALYLLGHVGFRLRNVGSVNRQRAVTVVVLLALVPVAWQLPALASLGLLATVLVVLIGYEATVHAEARHAVRHAPEH